MDHAGIEGALFSILILIYLPSQALPLTEREPGDMALMTEARRRCWQRCGGCKQFIELMEGCNHITCTCGFEFCYTCGKPWKKIPGQHSKATCTLRDRVTGPHAPNYSDVRCI